MKTKLTMIAVIMAIGAWLAVGDSPRVRSMEQRVAELEQVVSQLNQVVASQQEQIVRFSELAGVMQIEHFGNDFQYLVVNCNFAVKGGLQADDWLSTGGYISTLGNIYYMGELVHWER